jgi:hypothetical protein
MTLLLITDLLGRMRRAGLGRRAAGCAALLLAAGLGQGRAWGVSCTTQTQMAPAERAELAAAVTRLAGFVIAGDTAALKAGTLGTVAAQFDGIAGTVDGIAPGLKGATVSVENLYLLHAADLKAGDDEADFFCSVPGSQLLVTVSVPQLPAGEYALALVHANGVAKPEQMGMILARYAGRFGYAGGWGAERGGGCSVGVAAGGVFCAAVDHCRA